MALAIDAFAITFGAALGARLGWVAGAGLARSARNLFERIKP